jgi:hypothetical protein
MKTDTKQVITKNPRQSGICGDFLSDPAVLKMFLPSVRDYYHDPFPIAFTQASCATVGVGRLFTLSTSASKHALCQKQKAPRFD